MNVLIILAHPNPNSFNHAIAQTLYNNLTALDHNVTIRDLYQIGFKPELQIEDIETAEIPEDIQLEQKFLHEADLVFFVYPTWFMSMPAILKGYFDRVMYYEYLGREENKSGMVKGKLAYVFQTTGFSREALEQAGITIAMKHIQDSGILELVGFKVLDHQIFYRIPFTTLGERESILTQVKEVALHISEAVKERVAQP